MAIFAWFLPLIQFIAIIVLGQIVCPADAPPDSGRRRYVAFVIGSVVITAALIGTLVMNTRIIG